MNDDGCDCLLVWLLGWMLVILIVGPSVAYIVARVAEFCLNVVVGVIG